MLKLLQNIQYICIEPYNALEDLRYQSIEPLGILHVLKHVGLSLDSTHSSRDVFVKIKGLVAFYTLTYLISRKI